MGHVSASEPISEVGVARSQRMRVSTGALLGDEAGSGASGHVIAPEPSLSREEGFGAMVARGSAWAHGLPFDLA
jgi:hypothetical protein